MMQSSGSVRYSHPIFHGSRDQESRPEFPIPRQARREGGGDGGLGRVRPHLLKAAKVHLFVDQRISRLELGTQLKHHDDQHC